MGCGKNPFTEAGLEEVGMAVAAGGLCDGTLSLQSVSEDVDLEESAWGLKKNKMFRRLNKISQRKILYQTNIYNYCFPRSIHLLSEEHFSFRGRIREFDEFGNNYNLRPIKRAPYMM